MMYIAQNYWVFELRPSSGILETTRLALPKRPNTACLSPAPPEDCVPVSLHTLDINRTFSGLQSLTNQQVGNRTEQ
jgi:hypothetical protein